MEVILLLIPIALIFVGVALWLFFWAVDNGQFDDLDSPAHRILFDDDLKPRGEREQAQPASTEQQEEKNA